MTALESEPRHSGSADHTLDNHSNCLLGTEALLPGTPDPDGPVFKSLKVRAVAEAGAKDGEGEEIPDIPPFPSPPHIPGGS